MECKKRNIRRCDYQTNGYADGYGYPAEQFPRLRRCRKEVRIRNIEGSFWLPTKSYDYNIERRNKKYV